MGDQAPADGRDAGRGGPFGVLGRIYSYQPPMGRMLLSLAPIVVASVFLFGWRSVSVILVCVVLGTFAEWLFCRTRGEKVSSAVLVTAVLLALTMPPTVPYMVTAVAIVVAVVFGKQVFGGLGRNVYNPALVGRCFVYVCFPVAMASRWVPPFEHAPGGFARWMQAADAVTRATPMAHWRAGETAASLRALAIGNVAGSLGETSAVLILAAAVYLTVTRTANWRIICSCIAGGLAFSALFHYGLASSTVPDPLATILGGAFLFGSVFMATDPISAPTTNAARYIYGTAIGGLTVIIRGYSNFPGGMMFAILLMNTFAPIMDHWVRGLQQARRHARAVARKGEEA
jgi:Na+-transporting NADH:ubiquinone oxidoreductase subunit B